MSNPLTLKVRLAFNEAEALKNLQTQMNRMQQALDKMQPKQTAGIAQVTKETEKATRGFNLFGTTAEGAINSMMRIALIAPIIGVLSRSIKDAVSLVMELDKAFTSFKIVTGASAVEIRQVDAEATKLSMSLGKLKAEVVGAVTEFARAGYSMEQSLKLAEVGISAANVGFTSLEKTTKFLIAGMKSFNIDAEDSARIMDVLFQVSNKTAVTLEGIGEAFLRAGNSFQVAGASLEQTVAMIAAANESIQDPAKVGTALKTISARLRGVSEDGEIIPTLTKDFNALGIEMLDSEGNFRNIYDVFSDLAEIFHDLSDLTQQNLIEKLAGKRQANILIGMLNNWETAQYALNEAMEAGGSVMDANAIYLDSIEGRLNVLKNTVNSFFENVMSSDFIKVVISFLQGTIGLLDIIINKVPILGATIGGAMVALGAVTGGLPLAIIGITTALLTVSQGVKIFGSNTEKMYKQLETATENINDLNERIANIEAIENRTEVEEKLIETLKTRLAIEKQLRDSANFELTKQQFQDIIQEYSKMPNVLGAIDEGLKILSEQTQKTTEEMGSTLIHTVGDAFVDTTAYIAEFEDQLIESLGAMFDYKDQLEETRRVFLSLGESTEHIDIVIDSFNKRIEETSEYLKRIGRQDLFYDSSKMVEETNKASESVSTLRKMLDEAQTSLATSVDEYDTYAKALQYITDNGYITQDMLKDLQLLNANFVNETGLNSEKMIGFINKEMNARKQGIIDQIELLKSEMKLEEERTKQQIRNVYLRAWVAETDITNMAEFTNAIEQQAKAIRDTFELDMTNMGDTIAMLENLLKQLGNIGKTATKAGGDIEKIRDPLTQFERMLRDINHKIAIYQQQLSTLGETESDFARMLQSDILQAYKLKEQLLEAQIEAHKFLAETIDDTTAEYDDYMGVLQRLEIDLAGTRTAIANTERAMKDKIEVVNELAIAMTGLQRRVSEIEHAVNLLDKQLHRTEGFEERMMLLNAMNQAYLQQLPILREIRTTLEQKRSGVKHGSDAWYEYTERIRNVNLEIETLTNRAYDAERAMNRLVEDKKSQAFKKLKDNLVEAINGFYGEIENAIEEQIKEVERQLKELKDLPQEILAEGARIESEISFLKDELSLLREINRAKLANYRLEQEAAEFRRRMAEMEQSITQKELKIEFLKLDDSLESQRRRAKLTEDIAKERTKIIEEERKYNQKQEDRFFEDELKKEEELLKAKIDSLEKQKQTHRDFVNQVREDNKQLEYSLQVQLSLLRENLRSLQEVRRESIGDINQMTYDELDKYLGRIEQRFADLNIDLSGLDVDFDFDIDTSDIVTRFNAMMTEVRDAAANIGTDITDGLTSSIGALRLGLEGYVETFEAEIKKLMEMVGNIDWNSGESTPKPQNLNDILFQKALDDNITGPESNQLSKIHELISEYGGLKISGKGTPSEKAHMDQINRILAHIGSWVKDEEGMFRDADGQLLFNQPAIDNIFELMTPAERIQFSNLLHDMYWLSGLGNESYRPNVEKILKGGIGEKYNLKLDKQDGWDRLFHNGVPIFDNGGRLGKGEIAVNKEQNHEWVLTDKNLMNIFERGMMHVMNERLNFERPSGETSIGTVLNIENQHNHLSNDVDVMNLGKNQARGIQQILSAKGVMIR